MTGAAAEQVVSYADASRIVREHAEFLANTFKPATEAASLLHALHRVLAAPLLADRDQPPFRRSTRDGFACRTADLSAKRPLRIIGSVRAGESGIDGQRGVEVGEGQAVEIMTGALVPAGADCVVMVEHTQQKDGTLRLLNEERRLTGGENIVPQGAEARSGAVVLPRGTRLAAAHVGAAAACGHAELEVYRRPCVAIVATGDELVELHQRPLAYQIRNSNSYSLAAQVLAAGGEPLRLPIARDEPEHLRALISTGLESDLLLLSGGVSMGKYDLVEEVLRSLGAEFLFAGALIQPGKPVVFGRIPSTQRLVYFFGLPGNPVSTIVTFSLFAAPLLSVLCGEPVQGPRLVSARLTRDIDVKPGLTRFLPAVLSADGPYPTVEWIAWQGSGDLAATSRSNCFLMVPADRVRLGSGESVAVLLA